MSATDVVKLRDWRTVSEADWEHWERRLGEGVEPVAASRERKLTCTAFYKADHARHARALRAGQVARGFAVDEIVEADVCKRDDNGTPVAFKPEASDSMKQFYARRWQPAYGHTQVAVEHSGEVGSPDVAVALERFTSVVAAAVRRAAGDGADGAAGEALGRAEEVPGLPVARLDGTAESGGAGG